MSSEVETSREVTVVCRKGTPRLRSVWRLWRAKNVWTETNVLSAFVTIMKC